MWKITAQFCEDPRAVGWTSLDFTPEGGAQLTHRFRLLTDDGKVCFEGVGDAHPAQRTHSTKGVLSLSPILERDATAATYRILAGRALDRNLVARNRQPASA